MEIHRRVAEDIGKRDTLLEIEDELDGSVRAKGTLANTIQQGKVDGEISRGKPARQWLDDVKKWAGLSSNEMWRLEGGPCCLEKECQS